MKLWLSKPRLNDDVLLDSFEQVLMEHVVDDHFPLHVDRDEQPLSHGLVLLLLLRLGLLFQLPFEVVRVLYLILGDFFGLRLLYLLEVVVAADQVAEGQVRDRHALVVILDDFDCLAMLVCLLCHIKQHYLATVVAYQDVVTFDWMSCQSPDRVVMEVATLFNEGTKLLLAFNIVHPNFTTACAHQDQVISDGDSSGLTEAEVEHGDHVLVDVQKRLFGSQHVLLEVCLSCAMSFYERMLFEIAEGLLLVSPFVVVNEPDQVHRVLGELEGWKCCSGLAGCR